LSTLASYGGARRRALPLVPLAPLVVVVFGVAVTLAIVMVGLDHLARASDNHAGARAELLAGAESARLAQLTQAGRLEAIQLAARRTGAELVVLDKEGEVVADATLGGIPPQTLRHIVLTTRGEAKTGLGRTRYAVRPIGAQPAVHHVVAFVRAPSAPEGGPSLITALIALTTLLIGVAATFAYAVARDANLDVEFLGTRVRAMARVRSEPTGEPVPVRTMDEVGALTSAFNELVGRFLEAEKSYHANLDRARAADRDRAAFLAAVSHELRSPLNAILGFAELLVAEVDGPLSAESKEEVEQIRGSGAHLLELINDILEFSALEGGQLKLSRTSVDLGVVAAEVLREAAGVLQGRPVQVRLEGSTGVLIDADPKRLRQILTNLVGNAIKFTARGEVVVDIARQGAYARIAVKDTGPGISENERAAIFEDYKQTSDEKRRRRGTGLGLAIARRLVLMHGGVIQVDSELGKGSTFRVLLPIEPPRSSKAPRA
jgi:signal transduction histidine kinase